MFHLFHKRIHESVALSAYLSAALTLHVAWIANWLVHRSAWVRAQFTLSESLGPVSGLYLKTVVAYILLFGICVLVFRGKDVSHWRDRVFWFFLFSIIMFLVFTIPFIFEFSIFVGS